MKPSKSDSNLLACPFCGRAAVSENHDDNGWRVVCGNDECHFKPSDWFDNEPAAVRAWNTRTPEGLNAPAEPITFKKDDRVLCGPGKIPRYYSHFDFDEGIHRCFRHGADSWGARGAVTGWAVVVPYVEGQ